MGTVIASGRRPEDVAVRLVVARAGVAGGTRLDQALLLAASEGGALDLLADYVSFQAARRLGGDG